jgi:methylenetetrahydrofolate reductase (NADPH)
MGWRSRDGGPRRGTRGSRRRGGLAQAAPLLDHPRYEIFPAGKIEQAAAEWLPAGATVTVTASPAKGLDATVDLAERLAARGFRAVPHLSARLVSSQAHLDRLVGRLLACGVEDVFVPAGDAEPPEGPFDSALSLLERLSSIGSPFPRVGITGYPESHPLIGDDVTIQAMWDKRRYATYIVSNLCFDSAVLSGWIRRVRTRGVTLALYAGLAGPLDRAQLLRMAARAGISDAARYLAGHSELMLRFGAPGGYSPDRLLERAGATLAAPEARVAGLHLFTFNQLRQTEQWRAALARTAGQARERPAAMFWQGSRAH